MIFNTTEPTQPAINWTDNNIPKSHQFDDIYYSIENGLLESRHTFVEGLGITIGNWPDDLTVIGELGCGTGLNICALLDVYLQSSCQQPLHIISVEGYPLDKCDINTALTPFKADIGDAIQAWLDVYPDELPTKLPALMPLSPFPQPELENVRITLIFSNVEHAFALWPEPVKADGWILDGFNPQKNPEMWSDTVFHHIAANSNAACRLATFTVAGNVKRGLQKAGFTVTKRPGYGKKRECLSAILM